MTDFFIHIPRSGGSSLRTLLNLNYRAETILSLSGNPQEFIDYLERPIEERKRIQLVQGHFPFGLHAGLARFRYFTLIREPVERHFSEFFYAQKYPEHHWHSAIQSGQMTLDDWAEMGENYAFYHQNTLCQFLSGSFMVDKPTYATFQAACSNLEKMEVFGLTHRFTESALMMAKGLGWKKPIFGIRNQIQKSADIPHHLLKKVASHQDLDCALFRFAEELFERRIKAQGKIYSIAHREYSKKVEHLAMLEGQEDQRFVVGQESMKNLEKANRLSPLSALAIFLGCSKKPCSKRSVPFQELNVNDVVLFFKALAAFLLLAEVKIYNRQWVRSRWLGLIDISQFPDINHPQWGKMRIESDFSKRYPFKITFADSRLGTVWTNEQNFPLLFDESGQARVHLLK